MRARLRITDLERDTGHFLQTTLDQALNYFAQEGCLVFDNLFPRSFIENLSAAYFKEFAPLDEARLCQRALNVGHRRLMLPLVLKPPFSDARFFAHPLMMSLMNILLGGQFVLHSCSVVLALPQAEHQQFHRDNAFPYGFSEPSAAMPPYAITLALPLVDLTAATGTTELLTGSHLELRAVKTFAEESGPAPLLQLGDAYLMDYRLVHRGTANQTAEQRPIIYMVYTRPWYVDSANYLERGLDALLAERPFLQALTPPLAKLLIRAKVAR